MFVVFQTQKALQHSHTSIQGMLEQRKTVRTKKQQTKAWFEAADAVKTYSDSMIHRWNKEIDVYLVFVRAQ